MATRGVSCSYQEVIDLNTDPDSITVLGIHTPTGDTPRKMFKGFFDQYKKYRYNGCSISLVPAAQLPADMLQVSYEAGDYIDMRDALNPIMFHGCHGDDMGTILNHLYGDNAGVGDSIDYLQPSVTLAEGLDYAFLESLYYKALTDNSWKKAHPQRGFRKSGLRPLVYSMATNRQIMPGSLGIDGVEVTGIPQITGEGFVGVDSRDPTSWNYDPQSETVNMPTKSNLQFFTPRLTSLGWMDTKNVLTVPTSFEPTQTSDFDELIKEGQTALQVQTNYAELPKIFMGVVLLSKMYKVSQYFRCIINHHFAFKDFRGISFKPELVGTPSYFNAVGDISDPSSYDSDFPDGPDDPTPGPEPEPEPEDRMVGLIVRYMNDSASSHNATHGTFSIGSNTNTVSLGVTSIPAGQYVDVIFDGTVMTPFVVQSVATKNGSSGSYHYFSPNQQYVTKYTTLDSNNRALLVYNWETPNTKGVDDDDEDDDKLD